LSSLSGLEPSFRKKVEDWWAECEAEGIELLIYCGLRTFKEQDDLYAQGRTEAGRLITNARGGQSFHNYGRAIDYVPLKNGRADWDDDKTYARAQAIGAKLGLRAISWETPHLEDGSVASWRDLAKVPTIERKAPSVTLKAPASTKPRKAIGRGLR
jgi:D-alanyl-D-alanine carboxypeptidase